MKQTASALLWLLCFEPGIHHQSPAEESLDNLRLNLVGVCVTHTRFAFSMKLQCRVFWKHYCNDNVFWQLCISWLLGVLRAKASPFVYFNADQSTGLKPNVLPNPHVCVCMRFSEVYQQLRISLRHWQAVAGTCGEVPLSWNFLLSILWKTIAFRSSVSEKHTRHAPSWSRGFKAACCKMIEESCTFFITAALGSWRVFHGGPIEWCSTRVHLQCRTATCHWFAVFSDIVSPAQKPLREAVPRPHGKQHWSQCGKTCSSRNSCWHAAHGR